MTLAELYSAQDLLPIDLICGSPLKLRRKLDSLEGYVGKVKRKLKEIHISVRERVDIKSSQMKA